MVSSSLPSESPLGNGTRNIYQPVFSQQRVETSDDDPFERGAYNASRRPSNTPTLSYSHHSDTIRKKKIIKRTISSSSGRQRRPSIDNDTASSITSQPALVPPPEPLMKSILESDDLELGSLRPCPHTTDNPRSESPMETLNTVNMASGNLTYTIDEALDAVGYGKFQIILLCLCGIGFALAAVELVLLSILLPFLHHQWTDLSHLDQSLLPTVVLILQIAGVWFWAAMSNRYGRRKTYIFPCLFGSVVGCISAICQSYSSLVTLRAGVGFCLGGHLIIDMTYYFESLPSNSRGYHAIIFVGFCSVGIAYVSSIGMLTLDRLGWRYFLFFCSLPHLVLFVLRVLWNYESVRYLARFGKMIRADQVLKEMARLNSKPLPPGKLEGIQEEYDQEHVIEKEMEWGKQKEKRMKKRQILSSILIEPRSTIGQETEQSRAATPTTRPIEDKEMTAQGKLSTNSTINKSMDFGTDIDANVDPDVDIDTDAKTCANLNANADTAVFTSSPSLPVANSSSLKIKSGLNSQLFNISLTHQSFALATVFVSGLWFTVTFAYCGLTTWLADFMRFYSPSSNNFSFPFLLLGLSQIPGLALACFCIHRLGRKLTLILALLGCALFTFLFSLSISHEKHWTIIFYPCMIYFFLIGAAAVILIYIPELYPAKIRNYGPAVASALSNMAGVCSVPLIAILLDSQLNFSLILLFLSILFIFAAFLAWLLNVETNSKKVTDEDFVLYDGKFRAVNEKSQIILAEPLINSRLHHSQRSSTLSSFSQ